MQLVGIVEPDAALVKKYADRYHLEPSLFFADMEVMLDRAHPAAVLVTSIQDHRAVIEKAAKKGVSAMVEKPLTTTLADAIAIRQIARERHVEVLVNYETTWYPSDLSSLDTNMVVMQILDAARESSKEGRTIALKPLPE